MELQSGGKYCFVTVAVGRNRGSGSDFISIKAFGEVAKNCGESLKKGDRVAIVGHMLSSSFVPTGKKEKVYRTDIVADTVLKLPKGGTASSSGGFIDSTEIAAA